MTDWTHVRVPTHDIEMLYEGENMVCVDDDLGAEEVLEAVLGSTVESVDRYSISVPEEYSYPEILDAVHGEVFDE